MNHHRHLREDWQDYLHALPEASPPPGLRARVLAAPAPGNARLPLWALAAAVLGAAVIAIPLLRSPTAPDAHPSASLASAQALEHRMLDSGAGSDPRVRAGIAEIDRALGAAYRRNAGAEEIDALWRARVHALERGMTAAPAEPARI